MDRIVLQYAGSGERACNRLVGMVLVDRGGVADPGKDTLPAAGKSREEMRFDEAFSDQQLGLHRQLVDDQPSAGGQDARVLELGIVAAVMDDDFFFFECLSFLFLFPFFLVE